MVNSRRSLVLGRVAVVVWRRNSGIGKGRSGVGLRRRSSFSGGGAAAPGVVRPSPEAVRRLQSSFSLLRRRCGDGGS